MVHDKVKETTTNTHKKVIKMVSETIAFSDLIVKFIGPLLCCHFITKLCINRLAATMYYIIKVMKLIHFI